MSSMAGSSRVRSPDLGLGRHLGQHPARRCPFGEKASRWRDAVALAADVVGLGQPAGAGAAPRGRPPAPAAAPPARPGRAACRRTTSRPWSTTSTRSQSRSMSLMSWVVSSRVVPCSARSAIRNCRSRSLLIMSRPMVGSSSTSSRGLCTSAAATSPRIRSPSDSWRTGVSSSWSAMPRPSTSSAVRSPAAAGRAGGWRPGSGTSRAAAGPTRAGCAGRTPPRSRGPARRRCGTGSRPQVRTVPAGRHQDAGDHLDGGGLAGPVGADVAARDSPGDRSGADPVDGVHDPLGPAEPGPPSDRTTNDRRSR